MTSERNENKAQSVIFVMVGAGKTSNAFQNKKKK